MISKVKEKLKAKCDRLVSEECRSIGKCQICRATVERLEWAHFVTRRIIKLRYEKRNYVCLCATCHWKFDHGFWDKRKMWDMIKGTGTAEWLLQQANKVEPIKEEFYLNILERNY